MDRFTWVLEKTGLMKGENTKKILRNSTKTDFQPNEVSLN